MQFIQRDLSLLLPSDTESKVFCFALRRRRAVYLWLQKRYYKLGSILSCYWHFFFILILQVAHFCLLPSPKAPLKFYWATHKSNNRMLISDFNISARVGATVVHMIKWWQWMVLTQFQKTPECNWNSEASEWEITVKLKRTTGYLKFQKTHAGRTFTKHLRQLKYEIFCTCDLLRFWTFLHKYYAPSADNLVM